MQQITPPIERLITRKMAAEILGVTTKTIDVWVKDKKLTRIKFGNSRNSASRLKLKEVLEFIDSSTQRVE